MSTTPPDDDPCAGTVLGSLRGAAPDVGEVEAFDVAMEGVSRVIAHLTAVLGELRGRAAPEPDAIAAVEARRDHFLEARASLRAADHTRVAALREECTRLLRGTGPR